MSETFEQLFARIKEVRVKHDRRRAIADYLDAHGGYLISDIMMLPSDAQVEVLETVNGITRVGGKPTIERLDIRPDTFSLRTVDGQPLGKIKLGFDPSWRGTTTRDARRLARLGRSPYLYKEFGAEFSTMAAVAVPLLTQFGYGIALPRIACRNAELREETDSAGRAVRSVDRWRLVEVGSAFEAQAREAGDLKPIAPPAEPKPRARS